MDTLGLILVVVVTAASVQERDGAKLIFNAFTGSCKKLRRIWVDGGYRGLNLMEWVAQRFHIVLQAILRSDDTKALNYYRVTGLLKEPLLGFIVIVG